jgi:hypothetical protein
VVLFDIDADGRPDIAAISASNLLSITYHR